MFVCVCYACEVELIFFFSQELLKCAKKSGGPSKADVKLLEPVVALVEVYTICWYLLGVMQAHSYCMC